MPMSASLFKVVPCSDKPSAAVDMPGTQEHMDSRRLMDQALISL